MIVNKAVGKIKKALGKDTVEDRWYEAPLYEFTLEKEASEVTIQGHNWEWNKGDVVVYKLTDGGWAKATVYPFMGGTQAMKSVFSSNTGFKNVAKVSGVKDVKQEQVGLTNWDITVDVASGSIVDVTRSTSYEQLSTLDV